MSQIAPCRTAVMVQEAHGDGHVNSPRRASGGPDPQRPATSAVRSMWVSVWGEGGRGRVAFGCHGNGCKSHKIRGESNEVVFVIEELHKISHFKMVSSIFSLDFPLCLMI